MWENHAETVHPKLVPEPVLFLINTSKQPLYSRNYFKDKKYFERRLSKSLKKSKLYFFLLNPDPFKKDKFMKNKIGRENVTSRSSG